MVEELGPLLRHSDTRGVGIVRFLRLLFSSRRYFIHYEDEEIHVYAPTLRAARRLALRVQRRYLFDDEDETSESRLFEE